MAARRTLPTDPDIRALVAEHGGIDAFEIIRAKADALLQRFDEFDNDCLDPVTRIKALASVNGLDVRQATNKMPEGRVAMFVPSGNNGAGYVVYDSTLPSSRVVFSIAHEIVHSFIPGTDSGVRFRSTYTQSSRPVRQLEMLCEFGASLLTMPDAPFSEAVRRAGFGLAFVDIVRRQFGTSFEATTYRMAQVSAGAAAAKLFHRLSKEQMNRPPSSGYLFPMPEVDSVVPKYRCQSFHHSPMFPGKIPFNKSFAPDSVVYRVASAGGGTDSAVERIPVVGISPVHATVEAIRAPYQRPDTDPHHPDMLVLMRIIA